MPLSDIKGSGIRKYLFKMHSVVAILGPRQVGKTTLSKIYAKKHKEVHRFDLEDTRDLSRLDNPMLVLEKCKGLITIDEIQRKEDLFPSIRVLVDQKEIKRRFLILGSASPQLLKQTSETLAGRIAYLELPTLSLLETNNIERDISSVGIDISAQKMRQLLAMLAYYNANKVNYATLSTFLERSSTTLKHYADILIGTLMLQKLMPWHENKSC